MKRIHGNLLVFLVIGLLALGLASICATFTGSYVNPYLPKMDNHSDRLTVVSDGNFTPEQIKPVQEVKKTPAVTNSRNITVNNTNTTNNTVNHTEENNTHSHSHEERNDNGSSDY